MALKTNDCPCCKSVDTIAYPFDGTSGLNEGRASALASSVMSTTLRALYPDARKCIDCDYVWWEDPRPPIDLSKGFTIDHKGFK